MSRKLVIIGGGPHAKVISDILKSNNEYDIAGLVDNGEKDGFWDIKVIGRDECLKELYAQGIKYAFVGIGDNGVRKRLYYQAKTVGFCMVNVISKNAVISDYASLGNGIAVMPGAVINADTVIGDGCIINTNASVDHDNRIGPFTHIAPGSALAGSISIGQECLCGVGCRIIDRIAIGDNVVVGAGSVVIQPIESNSVVVGVPAKLIKKTGPK